VARRGGVCAVSGDIMVWRGREEETLPSTPQSTDAPLYTDAEEQCKRSLDAPRP
jgi:hypothetical protein